MNDRSRPLPRRLEEPLLRALATSPVVVVGGSRQTGKSTLVRSFPGAEGRDYVSLDDLDSLARAKTQPDALLTGGRTLTIDEVQRAPEILLAVKRAVDTRRVPGRFLLTGSANLLLMRRVAETLAGRVRHLTLWPMTLREQDGVPSAGDWEALLATPDAAWLEFVRETRSRQRDWRDVARRGGYPVPALEFELPEDREAWFAGYVLTYLERDLRDLSAISSLVDFRRLLRAVCLRLGGLVNQTEIARDVGLSQPTVHRHLDLLEVSYLLLRIPAYAENRTKRLIKAPKIYWCDAGLALHLSGETEPRGAHLENVVLSDLLAWASAASPTPTLHHWRAVDGTEVDFVVERRGDRLPIEIKGTTRPTLADARGLVAFRAEYGRACRPGLLLHGGREVSWIADGVLAAPWWRLVG